MITLTGAVTKHPESVVLPLLLPDSPVVVWWPAKAPADPAADPLGRLARRRITDAAAVPTGPGEGDARPVPRLRAGQHRPGLDPDHRLAGAAGRRARPDATPR